MKPDKWRMLGWEHLFWELVRYYLSITAKEERESFVAALAAESAAKIGRIKLKLEGDVAMLLIGYLDFRSTLWNVGDKLLRTEEEATAYCKEKFNEVPKTTQTKNPDHHQSSKAMVLAATRLAEGVCTEFGVTIEANPQRRCVWVAN